MLAESFSSLWVADTKATRSNEPLRPSEEVPNRLCHSTSVDLSFTPWVKLINKLPKTHVVVTEPKPQWSSVTSTGPHEKYFAKNSSSGDLKTKLVANKWKLKNCKFFNPSDHFRSSYSFTVSLSLCISVCLSVCLSLSIYIYFFF